MTFATSFGFFVYLTATRPAPPAMPVQAAGPHGLPVATQSKFEPILVEKFGDLPGTGIVECDLAVDEVVSAGAIG